MNKYEIINRIEQFSPKETAEAWDCVGFMVETDKSEVSKIMLCLTVTKDIVSQALRQNCDMIISHHPLFCVNCHSGAVSESYAPLIDIYSAHTNLDRANGGTTDTLIKTLGYEVSETQDFLRFVNFENAISVEDFSKKISTCFPNARFVNNRNMKSFKRAAFCAGSGSEFISDAKQCGADVLVTGDLKFHTALDSEIALYDIGHFESEILVLPKLAQVIGDGVEIVFADEKSPFQQVI
ncbi:MAG: Nif3-like dinuclear metal center hexameric protein [Muribaculaceae bacterium]|nr:Nif3-like dinuclear metal center hexameric protein [Muribaculaceae bacterium]